MPNKKLQKLKNEKHVCAGEFEENLMPCESVTAPQVRSQFL